VLVPALPSRCFSLAGCCLFAGELLKRGIIRVLALADPYRAQQTKMPLLPSQLAAVFSSAGGHLKNANGHVGERHLAELCQKDAMPVKQDARRTSETF
jgi:hypothetical protein